MSTLFLHEDELRQLVTLTDAMNSIRDALAADREGQMHLPGEFTLHLPDAGGTVRAAGVYVDGAGHYTVTIHSEFCPTPELAHHHGITILFNAQSGRPAAIIQDNGYLARLRTAALAALTADRLAPASPVRLSILDVSSKTAYLHLKALLTVRQPGDIWVWDESPAQADNFAAMLAEEQNLNLTLAESLAQAVETADLLLCPAYLLPQIPPDLLTPGMHLSVTMLRRRDRLDTAPPLLNRIHRIFTNVAPGFPTETAPASLTDLLTGKLPAHPADEITLAFLHDQPSVDLPLATLALEKALFHGIGHHFTGPLH
ncbi:MAG: hypothetical protein D6784_13660 [Chloroflexi bacterium]|nr:MAG: hypothetical protein D6784_13660 [Chloroflexota bacterium]